MASSLDTFVGLGCWEESLNASLKMEDKFDALLKWEDKLDPSFRIFAAIGAVVRMGIKKKSGL